MLVGTGSDILDGCRARPVGSGRRITGPAKGSMVLLAQWETADDGRPRGQQGGAVEEVREPVGVGGELG